MSCDITAGTNEIRRDENEPVKGPLPVLSAGTRSAPEKPELISLYGTKLRREFPEVVSKFPLTSARIDLNIRGPRLHFRPSGSRRPTTSSIKVATSYSQSRLFD